MIFLPACGVSGRPFGPTCMDDPLGNSLDRAQTAFKLLREARPLLSASVDRRAVGTRKVLKEMERRIDELLTRVDDKNGR